MYLFPSIQRELEINEETQQRYIRTDKNKQIFINIMRVNFGQIPGSAKLEKNKKKSEIQTDILQQQKIER